MKREEIKKAALNIFANKGYGECSMQDIADAVGINKASLYFYFKSKDDLYRCVLQELIDAYRASIKDIICNTKSTLLKDILFETFRAAISTLSHDRLLLWKKTNLMCLSSIQDDLRQSFREIFQKLNQDLIQILRELISQKSDMPPEDIECFLISYYIFVQSFLDWMIINEFRNSKRDVEEFSAKMWEVFWNGNKI